MKSTTLLALTALAGVATTAGAQDRAGTEARARVYTSADRIAAHRAALGITTETTGTARDTLGVLVASVTRNSPAERAGIEEGNRIAAINGTSLRTAAADVEDQEMSGAMIRRLTRELAKSKPGDEVRLDVWRDGRMQTLRVKTADSDSLFRSTVYRTASREDRDNRPALGLSIGSSGSRRDTLGVLVMGVADSSPASRAGIEEGNRIAAINNVNLRVAREDAGDGWLGSSKAQRLQREISSLKPGDNVTLKLYADGRFRDVTLKVARAGDLPKRGAFTIFGGGDMPPMPAMAPMAPMAPMLRMSPRTPMAPMAPMGEMRMELTPEMRSQLQSMRVRVEQMRPQLEEMRPQLEEMRAKVEQMRPQLERMRIDAPRMQFRIATPRMTRVIL